MALIVTVSIFFANDVLGYTEGHMPRHARVYKNFKKEYEKLQAERLEAFKSFHQDTIDKKFVLSVVLYV